MPRMCASSTLKVLIQAPPAGGLSAQLTGGGPDPPDDSDRNDVQHTVEQNLTKGQPSGRRKQQRHRPAGAERRACRTLDGAHQPSGPTNTLVLDDNRWPTPTSRRRCVSRTSTMPSPSSSTSPSGCARRHEAGAPPHRVRDCMTAATVLIAAIPSAPDPSPT